MKQILSWIESRSEARWLVSLVVIAVGVRLGWAGLMLHRQPRFDEVEYARHALELSNGQGYLDPAKNKDAFWPVGYPLVLSLVYRITGPSHWAAVGLQICLETLTCLLLYFLGKQTFGILVARVAALLLAVYPNQIFFSTLYLTEPLFTLLLLGAFVFLLKTTRSRNLAYLMCAGVLFGLAALTRPPILLFPLALAIWFLSLRRQVSSALLSALVVFGFTLITVSPWLIRNHQLWGHWTDISTSGGMVFWAGNNPRALGGYASPKDVNAPLWDGQRYDWRRGYRLGWENILASPSQAVIRSFYKISYFFSLETDGALWNLKGLQRPARWATLTLLVLANSAYLLMLATGLLGLLCPGSSSPLKTFFMLLSGFLLLIAIVFTGDPRYHYPLVPFMLLFSSKGLLQDLKPLLARLRHSDPLARRQAIVWMLAMSIIVVMMIGNLGLKYLESKRYT